MVNANHTLHVPERFLRQLWLHQRFTDAELQTTDGRTVEIISPGRLNRDGGPDCRDARIRIGGILYTGDVELHQQSTEWHQHSHQSDPKYNGVILHVVFHDESNSPPARTSSKRNIPVLALSRYLTTSFHSTWETMILDERAERLAAIRCNGKNDHVDRTVIHNWLSKLAVERIELKVRRFEERFKELVDERRVGVQEPAPAYDDIPFGLNPEELPSPAQHYDAGDFRSAQLWHQVLYEGVLEALGYSKNQEAFLRLARNVRLSHLADVAPSGEGILAVESVLFHAAGLLPPNKTIVDTAGRKYVRSLRAEWKERRGREHLGIQHESEWQFFRLRPENFPTIRIAAASRLVVSLFRRQPLRSIIQLVKERDHSPAEKLSRLHEMLIVPADDFWLTHYRFNEQSAHPLRTLLGKQRAGEIVLNVVIPLSLLYARIFKDKDVRREVLAMFSECPPASSNAITRIMGRQLLMGKLAVDSAMLQQGMLQLYKFYCMEERCGECAVGKVVFTMNDQ